MDKHEKLDLTVLALLILVLSTSITIALWPKSLSMPHVTLSVSDVQYDGTNLNLVIHFIMPENESLLCFGFKQDLGGNLTSFTPTTFMNGDSLGLHDPDQVGLPRGVPLSFYLASRVGNKEVDWSVNFEIPKED